MTLTLVLPVARPDVTLRRVVQERMSKLTSKVRRGRCSRDSSRSRELSSRAVLVKVVVNVNDLTTPIFWYLDDLGLRHR
jgi:hypothetical protein